MKTTWRAGNRARLLENGEEFFPAVFDAIRSAQTEVIVETFILFDDKVGRELHAVLRETALRGVAVDMMVDGFGSSDLSDEFTQSLTEAGVRLRTFDPVTRILGIRFNVLRRMHRKIVVIDGRLAFVGGINFSCDHLADFGAQAKQDYAVELEGPIVDDVRRFAAAAMRADDKREGKPTPPTPLFAPRKLAANATVDALLVTRDNAEHRNDIERHYCAAIRNAKKSVLIANAYFFPGYRLLRHLTRAARRGVEVRLILQGEPDMPIVKTFATMLYGHLQHHGVHVHEYCKRPLHGKVAVVDDDWSTVGSSNLDPLSLSLNLEANVVLRDAAFAAVLRERLDKLIEHDCKRIEPEAGGGFGVWQTLRTVVVFHFLRRFSSWASYLPRHAPRLHAAHRPPPATAGDARVR